jgi:hypothetical protein
VITTILFIFVGLPVMGFAGYFTYRELRVAIRTNREINSRMAREAERVRTEIDQARHPAPSGPTPAPNPYPTLPRLSPGEQAFRWNITIIVVGALIGIIGAGLLADPTNSALRQTVAALWLIAGLLGLVIAAIGTLGATLAHVMLAVRKAQEATATDQGAAQ